MADREKVIGHLNDCMEASRRDNTWVFVRKDIVEDAIELLKEHEAMLVEYSVFDGVKYGGCPRCNARIDNLINPKACGYCGQEVKWNA